jgi:hypothetical protein
MRDITDAVERLCRLDTDDLFVSKEETEKACKWMYSKIVSLEATVAELHRQIRANEVAATGAMTAMPILKEIRR